MLACASTMIAEKVASCTRAMRGSVFERKRSPQDMGLGGTWMDYTGRAREIGPNIGEGINAR